MTTTINNEHKELNFSSEREQSQACLNSAEHEKNQGRKVLNVPNSTDRGNVIRNVPHLRFPEFEGEWEDFLINDVCSEFKSGKNIKADSISESGEYPVYGGNGLRGYTSSYNHEGLYVLIGRQGALCGNVRSVNGKTYITEHAIAAAGNEKSNTSFLHYLFLKMNLGQYSDQSAQPGLAVNKLLKLEVSLPPISEQKKIAKLLSLLDERIATQNKIIDKLQSLIKGIGKQLFMDNQNWRTVKIGELLRIGNGKDYKHLSIGKIPVYGTGGQMLLVNDYLYDGESVCIGRKGTIDTPMFLKGKFWTVDTLFYTYDFKDVLPKFCYYLFLQINWKLYNEGTGVPSLSKSTIENIKVKIPSLEQQQKICSILDCYEHKTNNEEQILELYHSEKQYLLRQMFI